MSIETRVRTVIGQSESNQTLETMLPQVSENTIATSATFPISLSVEQESKTLQKLQQADFLTMPTMQIATKQS